MRQQRDSLKRRHSAHLAALLLAASAGLPQSAHANDQFRVELGFGYVDQSSVLFGRFNDLADQGGYGVLNVDWWRVAEDPQSLDWQLSARQLGLDSRRVRVAVGRPGDFRLWLSYVELPVYLGPRGQSPFLGVGSDRLSLPPGWQPASSTAGMAGLNAALDRLTPKVERRNWLFGLDRWLSDRWDVVVRMQQQSRQGLEVVAGTIGNTGGNPRVAFLPAPVDERTRELNWALRYANEQRQFELRYLLSLYDNAESALRWQNPYAAINGWHPSAGYPGEGQLARAPDNQFHQLSLAFAQRWSSGLRLSADLAQGRGTQNDTFLPYTINPTLAASVQQPLPRDSLEGRVDILRAQLRLSQPLGSFDWSARLRHDERDNRTPRDAFVYIGGDSALQDISPESGRRRLNEPYSYRQTLAALDGGYRTASGGQWRTGWEYAEIAREISERSQTREHRLNLQFRQRWSNGLAFSGRLQHADRGGSSYIGNRPYLSTYTPSYVATVAGDFENHPDLRRYHVADRERWQLGANLLWQLDQRWTVSLDAQRLYDDYQNSTLGLAEADSQVWTGQIQYAPNQDWTFGLLRVDERRDLTQNGHAFRGGPARLGQVVDPAQRWQVQLDDHWRSSGLNAQWRPPGSRLSLGLDLLHARGRSAAQFSAGSAVSLAPLPDETDRLLSARLQARWQLPRSSELRLDLWRERYRLFSPTREALAVDQLANVLLLGEDAADYDVDVITLTWTRRF